MPSAAFVIRGAGKRRVARKGVELWRCFCSNLKTEATITATLQYMGMQASPQFHDHYSMIGQSHSFMQQRWTSTESSRGKENKTPKTDSSNKGSKDSFVYVYESPLAKVVARLRTISLMTGICGSVGLPLIVAIKGGVVDTGLVGVGMAFVTGTLGSTAAIHFVFSPYVYSIERIPVRVCHFKGTKDETSTEPVSASTNGTGESCKPKDTLLKALTRTLFLRKVDIVFDPATELEPYNGMRPLCNFTVKGIPLYVHPEYVYDQTMRHKLHFDQKEKAAADAAAKLSKDNPDDFL